MAKVAAQSILQPFSFSTGQFLYYEHALEVAELLNYAAGNSPTQFFSMTTGDASWWTGGTGEISVHLARFTGAINTWVDVYRTHVWIDSDLVTLSFEATALMAAGNVGEARATIGGGTVTLTPFPEDARTTLSGNVAVSSTGVGWQTVTISLRRTSISGDVGRILMNMRIFAQEIAATSLPDPEES